MEQLLLDRQALMGEMFALEDAAATGGLEFIGFDPVPLAEADPVQHDDAPATAARPPRPARRVHPKAPKRPHSVRVWLDDEELSELAGGADAAGIALPDYMRARALKDPKAHALPAKSDLELFLRIPSPPSVPAPSPVPAPVIALSPDLEERIDAYYALDDCPDANAISYRPAAGDLKRASMFSRLGRLLTELLGVRPLGHRALPREGA